MGQNWVSSLDMLAANGVIDYDAASYLHGRPPRYAGVPYQPIPPMCPPPVASQPLGPRVPTVPACSCPCHVNQPPQDVYEPSKKDNSLMNNPLWKKVLFVGVAGAALVFGGYKLKNTKAIKWVVEHSKSSWNWVCDKSKKVWDWVKKPFSKTTSD